ncbi:cytotoxic and regulatory T-cell molecule isoform 2-T2 [Aulostomus maculatus]
MDLRRLAVLVLFIRGSLAVWQRVTVMKGQTLRLRCPVKDMHRNNVEWKNPEGGIMFFNNNTGVKVKRYSIVQLSESEFTISVSNVTFQDGGTYKCTEFDHPTIEKQVEVTVLGLPKIKMTKHEGNFVISCTAEGNHHPPRISWELDQGPEIHVRAQVLHEGAKYVSMDMLHIGSVETRVAVKCLVRHPSLSSSPLMNFVKIGRRSTKSTSRPPTAQTQGSTEVLRTATRWSRHGRTTVYLTATSQVLVSPVPSDGPPSGPGTLTTPSDKATDAHLSTGGWTSDPGTTETNSTHDGEITNSTENFNDREMQRDDRASSPLLVLLVTCLISSLLVVVIFFAVKLGRAHVTWKKENETSDPSEESSKSKTSQEERNYQGQRRGLFSTAFTQYVAEQPSAMTSVVNTAAEGSGSQAQTPPPHSYAHSSAGGGMKETEL